MEENEVCPNCAGPMVNGVCPNCSKEEGAMDMPAEETAGDMPAPAEEAAM